MGRKSIKANKNIYQLSREKQGLTREAASERMIYISDDRIEKIESDKSLPHPEEIITMSECYKNAALCNYYCSNECPIGMKYVPELELKELPSITLEVLNSLNQLQKKKDRLVEIAVDGRINPDEQQDFNEILEELQRMAVSANTLRLWLDQAAAEAEEEDE